MDRPNESGLNHTDHPISPRDLRMLARLHTLDVKALDLRGALNSDPAIHPMVGLIDNIRRLWNEEKMEPDGTMEACLYWLEQNMPPAPTRPSLIHAEYREHGGGDYSAEAGHYYGIWRNIRNAVYALTGQHAFHTDANPDMRSH